MTRIGVNSLLTLSALTCRQQVRYEQRRQIKTLSNASR